MAEAQARLRTFRPARGRASHVRISTNKTPQAPTVVITTPAHERPPGRTRENALTSTYFQSRNKPGRDADIRAQRSRASTKSVQAWMPRVSDERRTRLQAPSASPLSILKR